MKAKLKREMLPVALLLIFVTSVALWLRFAAPEPAPPRIEVPYSTFRRELTAGHVVRVVIAAQRIDGELSQPIEGTTGGGWTVETRFFRTVPPSLPDPDLIPELQARGVEIMALPVSSTGTTWVPIAFTVGPVILLLIVIGYVVMTQERRGGSGGLLSFGRSRARRYSGETAPVTFADVAGSDAPKAELREVVEFLKDPARFQRLGAEVPRGLLLVGPPGTGKTLLARATAGEAGVPFFFISGSEFVELFVGVGASRVRNLFRQAKEHSPAIVFVDEIDALGRERGSAVTGAHEERQQTLNQLLVEMDGFEPNVELIIIAATNRPDILDSALLRPGRFDRRVVVDLPSLTERHAILQLHARGKPLAPDVDLEAAARGTPGFSGADLENLLNEAALLAARAGKEWIENEDLELARDKVVMGLERQNLLISPAERRCMAYHEAGHAVVAAVLPHADPLHKVTIVPRGQALGITQQLPVEDKHLYTREYLLDKLATLMGGRAAEHLVLDTATTGAENDLKEATRLARRMVLEWGLADELENMAFHTGPEELYVANGHLRLPEYSEATARATDRAVRRILSGAFDRAMEILQTHRAGLDAIAEALIEHEVLIGDEVAEILADRGGEPQYTKRSDETYSRR